MRAIMSPSGSFKAIDRSSLPARLEQARDHALGPEVPERDAGKLVLAVIGPRSSRHLAAVADARRRRIARELRELQRRGEPFLHRLVLVARDRPQPRTAARKLLGKPAAPVVLLDRTLLRHLGLLTFRV